MKTKPIPVRLPSNMYETIDGYAIFLGVSRSEALRIVIKEGLTRKTYIGRLKIWQGKRKDIDPLIEMTACEKCDVEEKLRIYHIDGNIRNCNPENLVVLCNDCMDKLMKFIQKYNPKEKFAAWFFYE